MNLTETQEMKKRIDSVLNSAEKFSKHAELLSATKLSLNENINAVKSVNQELENLAKLTNKLIVDADHLINGAISEAVRPEVEHVLVMVNNCKKHCDDLTEQYALAIENLNRSKEIFAEQHRHAEELLANTTGPINHSLENVHTSITQLIDKIDVSSNCYRQAVKEAFQDVEENVLGIDASIRATSKQICDLENANKDAILSLNQKIDSSTSCCTQAVEDAYKKVENRVIEVNDSIQASSTQLSDLNNANKDAILSLVNTYSKDIQQTQTQVIDILNTIVTVQKSSQELMDTILINQQDCIASEAKKQRILTVVCSSIVLIAIIILRFI